MCCHEACVSEIKKRFGGIFMQCDDETRRVVMRSFEVGEDLSAERNIMLDESRQNFFFRDFGMGASLEKIRQAALSFTSGIYRQRR